ncbi:MAG: abortive infection protein [Anaerolineae bacterium]|nr:abortive infection protein [Anaerolineae bacterium]
MRLLGVNYDVGTFVTRDRPSRETFDSDLVQREMEIIKNDLHCNAIRIYGEDITRLKTAAELALKHGLEVWFSPDLVNATESEMLAYLAECAQAAEALRQQSPHIVFVVGRELTFFMQGLVEGDTALDRMRTFTSIWRLIKSTLVKGSFNKRLNAFLERAAQLVREHFHGQLTYAAGSWEEVDWRLFDMVSVDYYRDALNKSRYREKLQAYFQPAKPVVITEFGCCTYQGADDKGSYGWAVVDWSKKPYQLKAELVRDENLQAEYLVELLDIFKAENVDGSFVFTFVMPSYPYSQTPLYDLDRASYSLVKSYSDCKGDIYPDMPWEPKQSFFAVAEHNARNASD